MSFKKILFYAQVHDSVVSPLYWAVKDGMVDMARVILKYCFLQFAQQNFGFSCKFWVCLHYLTGYDSRSTCDSG